MNNIYLYFTNPVDEKNSPEVCHVPIHHFWTGAGPHDFHVQFDAVGGINYQPTIDEDEDFVVMLDGVVHKYRDIGVGPFYLYPGAKDRGLPVEDLKARWFSPNL